MIENIDSKYIAVLSALATIACDIMVKLISTVQADPPQFRFRPFTKPFTISFFLMLGSAALSIFEKPNIPFRIAFYYLIPASFSVLFLLLFNFSVIHGQAFISFILRQICMIFIPIILALKKPRPYQILVLVIGSIALVIAIASNIGTFLYPFLVLLSMVFKCAQIYSERVIIEKFETTVSSLLTVEGILGSIIIFVLVFPIAYLIPGRDESSLAGGALENAVDAFEMLITTPRIALGAAICIFTSFLSTQTTILLSNSKDTLSFVVSDILGSIGAFFILTLTGRDDGLFTSADQPLQFVALILYCIALVLGSRVIKLPWFQYSEWGQLGEGGDIPVDIDDLPVEE